MATNQEQTEKKIEKKTDDKAKSPAKDIRFTHAPDFKQIYVNYVQANFTPFDVTLAMGQAARADNREEVVVIELRNKVTLSPMEAKILVRILAGTVKNYEAQYGEINVHESVNPTGLPEGV